MAAPRHETPLRHHRDSGYGPPSGSAGPASDCAHAAAGAGRQQQRGHRPGATPEELIRRRRDNLDLEVTNARRILAELEAELARLDELEASLKALEKPLAE